MVRNRLFSVLIALASLVATARTAHAQAQPGGCSYKWEANSQDAITVNTTHTRLIRNVQLECNDIQLFADEAELFTDIDRVRASGNVVFVSGPAHLLSAEGTRTAIQVGAQVRQGDHVVVPVLDRRVGAVLRQVMVQRPQIMAEQSRLIEMCGHPEQ